MYAPPAADRLPLRYRAGFVLLALAALLPRVLDLGGFVTHDEAEFWFARAGLFLAAVTSGDFAATAISTHPGVTTMWLGGVGLLLRDSLASWGVFASEPFPLFLSLLRLPVALVHTGGILLGFGLLRRLLPLNGALLAALLWALDPFVIGYSRLLHVDALLGTFATLSLLAACVAWADAAEGQRSRGMLALSAGCAGLALLSKSPGLALLPVIGLLGLCGLPGTPWRTRVGRLALWGGVFALTLALVWPAVWADPWGVYRLLRVGVEVEGAQPHMTGNFFLGARADAPGPLYYPLALALRLTPWTLAGLLLLPLALRAGLPVRGRTLAVLAGFVLLFTLALSVFPKKFDRYLVPVFPALDILAALGLAGTLRLLAGWLPARWPTVRAGGLALLLAAALNVAHWHPYTIAAFNQALGGTPAGVRTVGVGWGEGYEQVAAWLNAQPDSSGVLTISRMITSLNPYLKPGVQAFFPSQGELRANAGYVVVYISEVQGGPPEAPSDAFYGREVPLYTARIHGVPYAWVYQVPPPIAQPGDVRFGETLALRGYAHAPLLRAGEPLTLTLHWQARAPLVQESWLFVHLVNEAGQRVAQVDMPLGAEGWQPGRFVVQQVPLGLPDDSAPGTYRLLLGLYQPQDFTRLPLRVESTGGPVRAEPALSGPEALLLSQLEVR